MTSLSHLSESEKKKVQSKLEELCKAHDVPPFDLTLDYNLTDWKKLVLAICGVPHESHSGSGRKPTDEIIIEKILQYHDLFSDFSRFEINDETGKLGEPLRDFSRKAVYIMVAEIVSELLGCEVSRGMVKNIVNDKQYKARRDDIKRQRLEALENDPEDPDSYFEYMAGTE